MDKDTRQMVRGWKRKKKKKGERQVAVYKYSDVVDI